MYAARIDHKPIDPPFCAFVIRILTIRVLAFRFLGFPERKGAMNITNGVNESLIDRKYPPFRAFVIRILTIRVLAFLFLGFPEGKCAMNITNGTK